MISCGIVRPMKKKKKPDKQSDNRLPKKPPTEHLKPWQFQPGTSGNPNGRPRGLTYVSRHKELKDMPAPVELVERFRNLGPRGQPGVNVIPPSWEENGRKLTWGDIVTLHNYVTMTMPNGTATMKVVWEMLEGKPTIRIEDGMPPPSRRQYDLRKLSVEDLRELRDAELRKRAIIEKAAVEDVEITEKE